MSWWSKGEDNEAEGEDGDEGDDEDYKTGVDKLIFLIDARVSMISNKFSSGECHLINSLKIALSVMKSKIIASENSSIGITFFGTVSFFSSNSCIPGVIYFHFETERKRS